MGPRQRQEGRQALRLVRSVGRGQGDDFDAQRRSSGAGVQLRWLTVTWNDLLAGIFTGGDMSETYTPANGTEGAAFFDCWCRRCARDKAMRDTLTGDLFA